MNEKTSAKKTFKSPFLAGLFSALFPGTGTLYNGDYLRGMIYIVIFAGLITMQTRSGVQPFAGLILAGFYFFQIFDSVHSAKMINARAEGEALTAQELSLPTAHRPQGSVFWGIFLIALGVVFLLANFDIILYEHIFDYWPLIIIIIGVKLIFDASKRHG